METQKKFHREHLQKVSRCKRLCRGLRSGGSQAGPPDEIMTFLGRGLKCAGSQHPAHSQAPGSNQSRETLGSWLPGDLAPDGPPWMPGQMATARRLLPTLSWPPSFSLLLYLILVQLFFITSLFSCCPFLSTFKSAAALTWRRSSVAHHTQTPLKIEGAVSESMHQLRSGQEG